MISTLIWLAVGVIAGAFLGWHFPQPSWAKKVEEEVTEAADKAAQKVKEAVKK